VAFPDRLEHLDGRDLVEPALDVAIVDEPRLDPLGEPRLLDARAGEIQLLAPQPQPISSTRWSGARASFSASLRYLVSWADCRSASSRSKTALE
jgi:hypothetical protein